MILVIFVILKLSSLNALKKKSFLGLSPIVIHEEKRKRANISIKCEACEMEFFHQRVYDIIPSGHKSQLYNFKTTPKSLSS